ncbi:hypothetical protein [Povalibacter sp.]|uniref:hypothetical protein n=1 Tax=Povalibacter sp. TaxID=1962978 RepID=UPI002F3FD653
MIESFAVTPTGGLGIGRQPSIPGQVQSAAQSQENPEETDQRKEIERAEDEVERFEDFRVRLLRSNPYKLEKWGILNVPELGSIALSGLAAGPSASVAISGEKAWFSGGRVEIKPGDTIVAPFDTERMRPPPFWSAVTSIVRSLAISAASVNSF